MTTSTETVRPKTADIPVVIGHVIGGERVVTGGRVGPVFNPATGRQTGEVALASAELVHEAARVAQAAQRAWSDT
ncbi:MAG: aldehyde dehydrogenase family protein, partial [Microbacterium sp.]